ncbi:glycosyl transferase, family 8 protein [Tanacetum coccineum]|uniref:Glycosyl transferase, family 8 protein n=1 Tax=Tanacetum coccineum TaxID=301880 RepID=A0ABQ5AKP1_9ASTR
MFKEAYYTRFGVPYPQGGRYRAAALGFYRDNGNPSYQERRQIIEESLSKFMAEFAKRHDENSNLIKRLKERPKMGYQIETSIDMNDSVVLKDSLPPKEKDPGSFTLPCYINNICFDKALADLGASVSVMPLLTFTNLGLGELAPTKLTVELVDRTIKRPKGIAKNVLVGIGLRERMDLDLEDRLMGKTLILNRSLDPDFGDFIELNDLNKPLELKRNQAVDLGPTIEGGEVIDKPMIYIIETRNDDVMVKEYPIVENMDPYRDQEMGDVIIGEPFCREICVKARRFNGMITIYNDNDSVTYQMARSHPRFKNLTNAQCNKIPPILKLDDTASAYTAYSLNEYSVLGD